MSPRSRTDHTERARPLLGARVAIRVAGLPVGQAHELISAAFDDVAEIHRLMSFHERGSDLQRLNGQAARQPVRVDARTWQVISIAQAFSAKSAGCFDITIARNLAVSGLLPTFDDLPAPDPDADWRDIELLADQYIRLRRPLWLDLGGIAKGYAVDRAVALLREGGAIGGCVNAGGDLRVFGAAPERVHLLSAATAEVMPVLEINDTAVASSGGDGAHFNGVTRAAVDRRRRVSVVAPDCVSADALSKIVLSDPGLAETLLPQYRAVAYLNDPHEHANGGWRTIAALESPLC